MRRIASLILGVFIIFAIVGCSEKKETSSEAECVHVMTRVERVQPTCAAEGNRAHYVCEKCDKIFFDAKGNIELSKENIRIAKLNHSLSHHAATETVAEYWHCFACDRYFKDAAATEITTYRSLYENAFNPMRLNDISSGNVYLSTVAGGALEPLGGDFTYRAFMTWENTEEKGLNSFPDNQRVQVNINLNDETTLPSSGVSAQWYNCGIGYSKELGLFYKNFEANDRVAVSQEFTQLFLDQSGIYVIVVREGAGVSLYLEDKDGKPHRISSGNFGENRTVVRLAVNIAESADSWIPSSTQTAICLGVGNPNCVFDKAYEN